MTKIPHTHTPIPKHTHIHTRAMTFTCERQWLFLRLLAREVLIGITYFPGLSDRRFLQLTELPRGKRSFRLAGFAVI